MTTDTIFPICSISKQMLCFVILTLARADDSFLAKLLAEVKKLLPSSLAHDDLTPELLAHNQSGIRDYWVLTVLWGAQPNGLFTLEEDGAQARKRLGKFHFQPGTQYSYCNANFRTLAVATENITGESLESLLDKHLFKPAGMKTAKLVPDTAALPKPLVGYEGRPDTGYFPEGNRLFWAGDAGVVASLEDFIAYEKFLDTAAADKSSIYSEMITPQTFSDGNKAMYRYGLFNMEIAGVDIWGHSGGLPGYTLQRIHLPSERLSVVVMRNSMVDVTDQAVGIALKALARPKPEHHSAVEASPDWDGVFLDKETQLAVQVKRVPGEKGKINIAYAGRPDTIAVGDDATQAGNVSGTSTATIKDEMLTLHMEASNITLTAKKLAAGDAHKDSVGLAGTYRCEEVDSVMHLTGGDGFLYGAFDGYLGKGPAHLVRHLGQDVWALECVRSLDVPAPGDWTLVVERDGEGGKVAAITVGAWGARKMRYERQK
ncbi:hypothetical protein ANO11243_071060 [Dothideomycetidae sp. 11243]|nr:hypothetical protein ANO11243_071060 [fungal sp. No.11243]